MHKEIKTEKFEGLAVLVPGHATGFSIETDQSIIPYGKDLVFQDGTRFRGMPQFVAISLPFNCEIVGSWPGLTEEQCAEIVDSRINYTVEHYKNYVKKQQGLLVYDFNDAVKSFASLMRVLRCYSVNPLPDPKPIMRQVDGSVYYGASDEYFESFKEAQANTGTRIILKKITT